MRQHATAAGISVGLHAVGEDARQKYPTPRCKGRLVGLGDLKQDVPSIGRRRASGLPLAPTGSANFSNASAPI